MKQTYRKFSTARTFVRKLKLTGKGQWVTYCKLKKKPKDIPNWPDSVYKNKGWISWSDFFGTNYTATYLRQYKSFSLARKFAQTLKLENQTQWRTYAKSDKLPKDIPRDPPTVYKKEWKGWADWLRDGKKITRKSKFLPFIPARKIARGIKISGQKEWNEKYCKSGNKPDDIPASPQSVYKKEWKGWSDWVGSGRISNKDRVYRDFEKTREFARKLKLASYTEWIKYRASEKRPIDIPSMPERVYKNKGWRGYGDFLGTGRGSKMIFWSIEKTSKFAQKLKIKSKEEYYLFYKSGKLSPEMPASPSTTYKKEWLGWGDYLGTGTIANQNKVYPSIDDAKKEARQLAIKLNLKTQGDWVKAHREGKIPKHLPANPWHVYAKNKRKKK
jgi:hypothetical protein